MAIEATDRVRRLLYGLGGALFLGGVFVLVLGMSMRKIINHDEHQFVAAGVLIARQGLVPYLDFPYFHVPGLAYLYALLFQWTDRLLLAARGLSVAASWLMLALLFFAPVWLFGRKAAISSFLGGMFIVLLLLSTQTFRYTTGWSWNHDVPVLLMCVACWLQIRILTRSESSRSVSSGSVSSRPVSWRAFLIGLCMGLAVAMRASFALPALVFALFALPLPGTKVHGWGGLMWLIVGGVVGGTPAWVFLLLAPTPFLFGNFEYVRLNTAHYLESGGLLPGQVWLQKWEMTRNSMITVWRANFALVLLSVAQLIRVSIQARSRPTQDWVFLCVLIPAALISGYAPTPMQVQYIYLVFPLLALLNLVLLRRDPWPRFGLTLVVVAALYAATQAGQDFRDSWVAAWQPSEWTANRVHDEGRRMAELSEHGHVITLSPIYPLEGGVDIVPGLVSGPFGWRVANLVEPEVRAAMGIVGPDEALPRLEAAFARGTPYAILVGIHGAHATLEPPLVAFAQAHGYRSVPVMGFAPEPGALWLPPD